MKNLMFETCFNLGLKKLRSLPAFHQFLRFDSILLKLLKVTLFEQTISLSSLIGWFIE